MITQHTNNYIISKNKDYVFALIKPKLRTIKVYESEISEKYNLYNLNMPPMVFFKYYSTLCSYIVLNKYPSLPQTLTFTFVK